MATWPVKFLPPGQSTGFDGSAPVYARVVNSGGFSQNSRAPGNTLRSKGSQDRQETLQTGKKEIDNSCCYNRIHLSTFFAL
jgi:hypothetical protein